MDKNVLVVAVAVCVCLISLMGAVSYNNFNKQQAMVEMVSKGANPQAVACAVDGVQSMNQQVCTALAINGPKGN